MKKMKRIDTAADAVAMGTEAPERQEEALRLRAALEETGRTLEPEDPAAAYDLRLPTEPSASGSGIVWVAGGAAAVLLLGSGVIVWMRKRKCTK